MDTALPSVVVYVRASSVVGAFGSVRVNAPHLATGINDARLDLVEMSLSANGQSYLFVLMLRHTSVAVSERLLVVWAISGDVAYCFYWCSVLLLLM